ncbi:MAG TPA: extracellular solute-binding protein [Gaiellaceae bacterium]|jgi:ABC-type glycerol-3-phosphate transport system substrate-binding protein|nr:extracellular solute-binding protein [Gaiellaceae bacterium]
MKRPHRRTIAALLAVALLSGIAAGCGGDDGGGANGDVSGSISVMGIWTGEEQKSFEAVIAGFNEEYPDVKVNYNSAGDNLPTVLSTAVEGGNPPDVAAIAQPGLMTGFVEKGALEPLDYAKDAAVDNFGQSVVDTGSVDDTFYGLMWKANNKSTVWYNVAAFDDAGVEPAETWDDFVKNGETIKASGLPAYSIAGADGWTLTDLFENIYLRTAGADKYDQLSTHEIPWTDQSVKDALTEMAKVFQDGQNIAGGTSGALQTDFPTSVSNVFSNNPKAAQVIEADFVNGVVETPLEPQTGFNVFTFPQVGDSPPSVVGAGNLFITFRTNPAIEAFINYMTTPESAEIWAERGGFSSPNKNLDADVYPDEILRTTAEDLSSAEVFRFDLSDLQPAAFGATAGQGMWKLFQDFLQNPDDVDGIADKLEQSAAKAYG